jgi:sulfopyruvate decarboxylase subunit alpha
MLISARGEFGEPDPWQTEGGLVTRHVLDALRIPYEALERPEHVSRSIAEAQTLAYASNRPVGLLLARDLMWDVA